MSAIPEQHVFVDCECGKRHAAVVLHYSIMRTSCQRHYWALQPKRGGPLVFYPWPGQNLTRKELAEIELREQKDAIEHLTGTLIP
jgi:hypothetical protein